MKNCDDVKAYIKSAPEYEFLRNDPSLIAVSLGGSLSYGTERYDENGELLSDLDVRGICFAPKNTLLGMSNFEQKIDNKTDTVIYSLNKFASLAAGCNPNIIEMLDPTAHNKVFRTEIGERLFANRQLFFSKVALKSFGGYASAQIDRLTNAVARDAVTQPELEEHIKNSVERMIDAYQYKYSEIGQYFKLYIDEASEAGAANGLEKELFCDVDLKHCPVRDYQAFREDLINIVKTYGKINHRNRKDEDHLDKHAMHIIRLFLTGIDLLENGDIHTYRPKDLQLLNDIRHGKYRLEDGGYSKEFFELTADLDAKLKYAADHTVLPSKPNFDKINELVISLNEDYLGVRY